MNRKEMDIYFHRHMLNRYDERMADIDSCPLDDIKPDFDENNYAKLEGNQMEREIRNKGRFFRNVEKSGETGKDFFICVVKGLKVYCGFFGDGNEVRVLTVYPFDKSLHKYMHEDRLIRFEEDLPKPKVPKKTEQDQ